MNPHAQFREDMEAAGYIVVEVLLPGREGEMPGVCCLPLEVQDVAKHTTATVRIEQLGQGFVVYPK